MPSQTFAVPSALFHSSRLVLSATRSLKRVVLLLLATLPLLHAQVVSKPAVDSGDDAEIVTDRPDVTEASTVIPKGSLQGENGTTWTDDHGQHSLSGSETLLRFGISQRFELRLAAPQYFTNFPHQVPPSGFSDLSVGFKQQVGPLPGGFDLSVIAAVSLPSGSSQTSSHGYDPFVKLPWSRELVDGWSVGGMQSWFWNTDGERRNRVWEPTFYLEKQVTKPLDVFVEFAGDYAQRGGSTEFIHFGAAYKVRPLQQVDFHFGFGLNQYTPSRFFACGYSFRLDHLWR